MLSGDENLDKNLQKDSMEIINKLREQNKKLKTELEEKRNAVKKLEDQIEKLQDSLR